MSLSGENVINTNKNGVKVRIAFCREIALNTIRIFTHFVAGFDRNFVYVYYAM